MDYAWVDVVDRVDIVDKYVHFVQSVYDVHPVRPILTAALLQKSENHPRQWVDC